MKTLGLTKDLYKIIKDDCDKFKEETWYDNDVDVEDVIYSYIFSTKDEFHILNDWDEGENNDPWWDKELNEHSAIVFLKKMCVKIDEYHFIQWS